MHKHISASTAPVKPGAWFADNADSLVMVTAIVTRLALANVKEARFYSESLELVEDWTPLLSGLKAEAERGESVVVNLPAKRNKPTCSPSTGHLASSKPDGSQSAWRCTESALR